MEPRATNRFYTARYCKHTDSPGSCPSCPSRRGRSMSSVQLGQPGPDFGLLQPSEVCSGPRCPPDDTHRCRVCTSEPWPCQSLRACVCICMKHRITFVLPALCLPYCQTQVCPRSPCARRPPCWLTLYARNTTPAWKHPAHAVCLQINGTINAMHATTNHPCLPAPGAIRRTQ